VCLQCVLCAIFTVPSPLRIRHCTVGPNLSHPVAYARSPRRHLAPTVGLIKALVRLHPDGIFFVISGARCQHHLRAPRVFFSFPGRRQLARAGIRLSWIYIGISGSALDFLRPAYICPDRHIYVLADIVGVGVDSDTPLAAIYYFWPEFALAGRHLPIPASPGRHMQFLGQSRPAEARAGPILAWAVALNPGLGRRPAIPAWAGASPAAGLARCEPQLGWHFSPPSAGLARDVPAGPPLL
jgi:hypothetical protein